MLELSLIMQKHVYHILLWLSDKQKQPAAKKAAGRFDKHLLSQLNDIYQPLFEKRVNHELVSLYCEGDVLDV